MFFVKRDTTEKNLRMTLNFGHTFAHAIEIKNNYSKKFTHGEAVLSGMILACKFSVYRKLCSSKTFDEIKNIYIQNNLDYTYKKYSNKKEIEIEQIEIVDNSHKHIKHKSFSPDKFHLHLKIKSLYLNSLSRVTAQKEVMKVLKDELSNKIHALEISIEQ